MCEAAQGTFKVLKETENKLIKVVQKKLKNAITEKNGRGMFILTWSAKTFKKRVHLNAVKKFLTARQMYVVSKWK